MSDTSYEPQKSFTKLNSLISVLSQISQVLTNIIEAVAGFLLLIMTLVIFWEVISRFKVINISSPWTEEVAMIMLVWVGMAGAAIGIRKQTHIGVEFVTSLFPKKLQMWFEVFVSLLILVFSIFLLIEGIQLARGCWDVQLPTISLSRGGFVYLAVPVASSLMIFYSLELIIQKIVKFWRP